MSACAEAIQVHEALVAALRECRLAEHRAAKLLARVADEGWHLQFGYATVRDYAESELHLDARQARQLLQLGRALPALPALDRALSEGRLGWTKAREILRVARPDNEEAWVETAARMSSRELEHAVTAAQDGDPPSHVGRPKAPEQTKVVFRMASVDADLVRSAIAWFRAAAGVGDEVEDGVILAMMAQRVVESAAGDEAPPTGERYRVVVEHCPECRRTAGVDAELPESLIEEARCDAEIVEMRPGPARGHAAHTIAPSVRRAVLHRDGHRCRVPGCTNRLWLDLHHARFRSRGGGHGEGNLVTLCSLHHRSLHEGLLGVGVQDGGFVFSMPIGGRRWVPMDPKTAAPDSGKVRGCGGSPGPAVTCKTPYETASSA